MRKHKNMHSRAAAENVEISVEKHGKNMKQTETNVDYFVFRRDRSTEKMLYFEPLFIYDCHT